VRAVPQIAANPAMLVPVTRLGEDAMLTIADSADYAALGEELNFWQLMVSTFGAFGCVSVAIFWCSCCVSVVSSVHII
jgi:hypothetical protein